MTSSQIQDGGRPLKYENRYVGISQWKMIRLRRNLVDWWDYDLTKIQIFKFQMADGDHIGKHQFCLIFAKFCTKTRNTRVIDSRM